MNKKYPWKQAIVTALIISVFAIGSFKLADSLNRQLNWHIQTNTIRGLTGLLSLIILGVGIYSGMRSIEKANSNKLSYGQAVFAGFTVAVTTGIILAGSSLIYCTLIDPGYTAYMIAESRKAMITDGKNPAEIAAAMPALEQQWTTGGQILQAFIGQTVCGTVIALIMGIFIRTKK